MADGVLLDGKIIPLNHPITGHPIPVFGAVRAGDDWRWEHGMEFKIGTGYNKPRRVPIIHGVIHWTGSENAVETMFRVLNNRKLGVEFAITPLGSLFQFCDPIKVDTADAGAANKTSWGVEVVNQGQRKILNPRKWKKPRAHKLDLGPRPFYTAKIHGKKRNLYGFYPAQVATLCALNRLMVDNIETYEANVCTEPGVIDWQSFRGAIGHLNIKRAKTDPGTLDMQHLDHFMRTGKLPSEIVEGLSGQRVA